MAANFKIIVNRERDNLHLRLAGDFDGSSALDLIRVLSEECGPANRVIIHTDGLTEVHPFGKAVFQRQLPPAGKINPSIVFIGKHAEDIAPYSEGTASRQVSIN
ncbi:MAG: hypothetical protein C4576_00455 [Desulfobacteraceae bacterium]|jgi:hypothetical protein|nr:MAG: hypothetical protein C4576_00455 [Desulfobacteraceae bacterium]